VHEREGGVITIRRIGVGSAFRVGALLSALLSLIVGLPIALMQGLFVTTIVSSAGLNARDVLPLFGGSTLGIVCFWVGSVVAAGLFGGVFAAISALLYNWVAGWIGGLEVELAQPDDAAAVEREIDAMLRR
jgi:hypothetical protein